MLRRSKHTFALALMLPLVAGVGLTAAGSSSAAVSRQQSYNGSFDAGRAGWTFSTPRTAVSIVPRGVGGGNALKVVNRSTGQVVLAGRQSKSGGSGLEYAVSAWVRTNQPGLTGRLVLKETRGSTASYTTKTFTAVGAWSKVSMTAVTKSASSTLQLRFGLNKLNKGRSALIDALSVVRPETGGVIVPEPTTPPPTPTPASPMLEGSGGGNVDRTKTGADLDRWYGGSGDVDKAITRAKLNHAAGVRTWMSFKLPHSWPQMAAGSGDAWAKALYAKLDALNFEVWVAFHHEPEGDGDTNNWRKMQDRLSRLVPGGIAGDIKFWLIVTGWTQEFNPSDTANQWSTLYPTGAPIYGIAYDNPYLKYGYRWTDGVKTTTMETGWTEGSVYVEKLAARAKSYGVKAGIGEYGFSDEAFAKDKTWLDRVVASAKANKLAGIAYFDTPLNSQKSWYLGSANSAKRAYFEQVMAR